MIETQIYEVPANVRARTQRVKKMLQEYRKKYNKIAVVSHYNTINYTCSENWDADNEPADSLNVKNCQVYETSLEQLLKFD